MYQIFKYSFFLLLAALLTSCSPKSQDQERERIVVILDFLPGPIHAGFYAAQARGDYEKAGLEIELRSPSSTSDTIRLLAAGQADVGLAPLLDYFYLRVEERPVKLLFALVQTPLSAVIASPESGITQPLDLEGKTVATTGLIGDEIIVKAMLNHAGGDSSKMETLNMGFNVIQALSAGQVDAALGFWSSDALQYAQRKTPVVLKSFEHGVPAYPELVAFSNRSTLESRQEAIASFIEITKASYQQLMANPEEALSLFAESVDSYTTETARPFFEVLLPVFRNEAQEFGVIDQKKIQETIDWLAKNGLPNYSSLKVEDFIHPGATSLTASQ
ncbi:MAG: ABC transporter substrate-binding protein [Verrucomicrobiota bacterium]